MDLKFISKETNKMRDKNGGVGGLGGGGVGVGGCKTGFIYCVPQ
jgi:hypothetical protein